jgi:glycosyltransferase involved in cell wall biosynthesis
MDMRIGLISFEYPPQTGWGGIGTQTRHKARGLAGRGHDVQVISAGFGADAGRSGADAGATVHRVAAPQLDPLEYDGPALWLGWSIAAARMLRQLAAEAPFDIVHCPEYGGEGFIAQSAPFDDPRPLFSLQLHGPVTMFAEQSLWPAPGSAAYETACFLERSAIHRSDLVMASSRNTAAFCAARHQFPLERIEVIYSGVDTDLFSPRPRSGDQRRPRILFVGKPSRSKGFPALVRAVLSLRGEFPGILLRTIGKITEDDTIAGLRAAIARAGADANFEFHGNAPYDDLPAHYAWCDLLAGPSLFEPGPGNVYLEAMSCARPVVACRSGGTSESVLDRQTGLLVEPDSPAALREAIAELAAAERLRTQLGAAGRDWVMDRFALGKYLDRVEGLYRRALDARSSEVP